jgi:hypothetical protein
MTNFIRKWTRSHESTAQNVNLFDVLQFAEHFHAPGKKAIDPEFKS